jgi:hypothetical protein
MLITFPNVLTVDESRAGNSIRQIGERGLRREGSLATFARGRLHGILFQPTGGGDQVLIIPKTRQIPGGYSRIVQTIVNPTSDAADFSDGSWLKHPLLTGRAGAIDHDQEIQQILESWTGAFSYVQEDPAGQIAGLRGPQIGAVHAVHSHWSISDAPATIVMPTGTGKTETMLSILVSARCPKLLVVVPTDTLRSQCSTSAEMGVLRGRP